MTFQFPVSSWYATRFMALSADVRRSEAVTLEEFTLNLVFIVS